MRLVPFVVVAALLGGAVLYYLLRTNESSSPQRDAGQRRVRRVASTFDASDRIPPLSDGSVVVRSHDARHSERGPYIVDALDNGPPIARRSWAEKQRAVVRSRLRQALPNAAQPAVSCSGACCEITGTGWRGLAPLVRSAAGFGGWARRRRYTSRGGRRVVSVCFDRSTETSVSPFPTRAKEYAAARAAAAGRLQKCLRLAEEGVYLQLKLRVSADGTVARAYVSGAYDEPKAAHCVERAIMAVAKFAPARHVSRMIFPVFLDPVKGTVE